MPVIPEVSSYSCQFPNAVVHNYHSGMSSKQCDVFFIASVYDHFYSIASSGHRQELAGSYQCTSIKLNGNQGPLYLKTAFGTRIVAIRTHSMLKSIYKPLNTLDPCCTIH